jgi:hypothetical protein
MTDTLNKNADDADEAMMVADKHIVKLLLSHHIAPSRCSGGDCAGQFTVMSYHLQVDRLKEGGRLRAKLRLVMINHQFITDYPILGTILAFL